MDLLVASCRIHSETRRTARPSHPQNSWSTSSSPSSGLQRHTVCREKETKCPKRKRNPSIWPQNKLDNKINKPWVHQVTKVWTWLLQTASHLLNMLPTSDTHPYMWKPDQWALDVIKQASQINNLCQIPSRCVLDHYTKRVSLLASS